MSCSVPEPSEPMKATGPVPANRCRDGATRFSEMTTIAVGGPVSDVVLATTEDDLIAAIKNADDAGRPLLMLGGGSNILAGDSPFEGVVVRDMRSNIWTVDESGCGGAVLRATAGTPWDELVVYTIEHGWMGVEAMSGIPGTVGAAPVQNIGAYGQEVAESIASVRTYDRQTQEIKTLFLSDLNFGYRTSLFKESMMSGQWGPSPRWIVLDVEFHMRRATLSRPIQYAQLASKLGVTLGERVPATKVRDAVLELRRSKSMVLDDDDRNTYSLGSFFTNPVLTEEQAAQLPPEAPRFGVSDGAAINQIGAAAPKIAGQIKTSAAWLISHAGFDAGYGMPGPAALSTQHCLSLTNRGGASSAEIGELAQKIRQAVQEKFGITLVPEPVLVGLTI